MEVPQLYYQFQGFQSQALLPAPETANMVELVCLQSSTVALRSLQKNVNQYAEQTLQDLTSAASPQYVPGIGIDICVGLSLVTATGL